MKTGIICQNPEILKCLWDEMQAANISLIVYGSIGCGDIKIPSGVCLIDAAPPAMTMAQKVFDILKAKTAGYSQLTQEFFVPVIKLKKGS